MTSTVPDLECLRFANTSPRTSSPAASLAPAEGPDASGPRLPVNHRPRSTALAQGVWVHQIGQMFSSLWRSAVER